MPLSPEERRHKDKLRKQAERLARGIVPRYAQREVKAISSHATLRLYEQAPEALAAQAGYFRQLSPIQVDRCWVGCVMSGITASLMEGGRFPTKALAEALTTARERVRALYPKAMDDDAADAATVANLTREPMRTGKA